MDHLTVHIVECANLLDSVLGQQPATLTDILAALEIKGVPTDLVETFISAIVKLRSQRWKTT